MKAEQRREREIAHARLDILEAAVRAFARSGLRGTTMQDIAREAGYTAASLYTYFKSKQEIIDGMSNHLTDEYVQVFEQPLPSGLTFRQRFELVLHRQLELAERRRNVFAAFIDDHPHGDPCSSEGRTFHDNFERRIESLAAWLSHNAKSEDLGGNDPTIVARLLFGMAFGLLHQYQWGDKSQPPSFVDYAPILTEFFFHGVSTKPKTGARKK
jgi:AcrR family transcriptional regulator